MPFILTFTRAVHKPAHSNVCGPLPEKGWTPML